jgi:hypothetical protein
MAKVSNLEIKKPQLKAEATYQGVSVSLSFLFSYKSGRFSNLINL